MRLCCTATTLCKRHQPPPDNPSGPIYLSKGEDVRKNPDTGVREIYVPDHSAQTATTKVEQGSVATSSTEPEGSPWAASLF